MCGAFIFFVIISEESRFTEKIYINMYYDSLRKLYTTLLSFQEELNEILQ
jgi:hypothetical protein